MAHILVTWCMGEGWYIAWGKYSASLRWGGGVVLKILFGRDVPCPKYWPKIGPIFFNQKSKICPDFEKLLQNLAFEKMTNDDPLIYPIHLHPPQGAWYIWWWERYMCSITNKNKSYEDFLSFLVFFRHYNTCGNIMVAPLFYKTYNGINTNCYDFCIIRRVACIS